MSYIFGVMVYLFFISIYVRAPLPLQVVMFAINVCVPDPIPALDEVIMGISTLKKIDNLSKALTVFDWCCAHKIKAGIIVLFLLSLIATIIF